MFERDNNIYNYILYIIILKLFMLIIGTTSEGIDSSFVLMHSYMSNEVPNAHFYAYTYELYYYNNNTYENYH
jgi:hypothetical protein